MLKNVLASIGIGGAKVDTIVDNPQLSVDETLSGKIVIRPGDVPQRIDGVEIELVTRCIVETRNDQRVYGQITVASARVAESVAVAPGELREVPFTMRVPAFAPLSLGSTSTVLRTRLDVPNAIDPSDSDAVRVLPNAAMRSVFEGMERAGFRLAEVEVEHNPRRRMPFVQEFDFRPTGFGDWRIQEVEIAFEPAGNGAIDVLVTVDRRGGLFSFGGETGLRLRVAAGGTPAADFAAALRRAIGHLPRLRA